MGNALSNPYEITVDGITSKVSPYGQGHYIALRDLVALGIQREKFLKGLFRDYAAEYHYAENKEPKELEGVRVFYKKPAEETHEHQDQTVAQGTADKGSGQEGLDSEKPQEGNSGG